LDDVPEEEILRLSALTGESPALWRLQLTPKRPQRRAVIDTSVLVAGIAGFREPHQKGRNPSADLLLAWAEVKTFLNSRPL
jgi:hypothetical protein